MLTGILSLMLLIGTSPACLAEGGAEEPHAARIGSISTIAEMGKGRAAHSATLLGNGKVLVAGGFAGGENGMRNAEIFDPASGAFSPTSDMNVARASHSATRLRNGKVLIAGGFNGSYIDSAELYDPATGRFAPAGKLTRPRSEHQAVLLADGRVLIAGGVGTGWTFLADAEIYDPVANTFTATGSMTTPRESHTATLLMDGRVLVTGGHKDRRAAITIYSSTEIYDPAKGTFTAAADLTVRRHKHDALLMDDGQVLIVGGSDERDSRGAYTTVEIYDPKTNRTRPVGDMNASRYKLQGTTIRLPNGKILIAGGSTQAEIYDPRFNSFIVAGGRFESTRLFSTATLLPNGDVLIIGGYDDALTSSSKAWVYKETR
jgi:hypothetical protein